jgi:tetratricopeptide (TPR) repeat protein
MTKLLDAATGEEILVLRNASQSPGSTNAYNPRVRWSHNGRMLAVNCDAGLGSSVCVWSKLTEDLESRAVRRRAAERRAVIGHAQSAAEPEWAVHSPVRRIHLDRIRSVDLGSAWEYADRGLGFFYLNDDSRAKADFARATALAPYAGIAYSRCGMELYLRGQLKKAREYYALGLPSIGRECRGICVAATLFAYFDDGELYRRYVKGCLIDYFDWPNPLGQDPPWDNAPALLRPDSGVDPKQLLEFSERMSVGPASKNSWSHWRHGFAQLRAGQYQAALDSFDKERTQKKPKSEPCPPELVKILRALALVRLNQVDAACESLAEAGELLKSKPIKEGEPVPGGYLRLAAEVLHREAAESIRGRLSANPG